MLKVGDYIAPTGGLIVGSVRDCNKRVLEKLLRDYDSQLYIKWNAKKRGGWGCWEIRRKPNYLTPVYQGQFNDQPIYTMERKELDLVAHVLDLNYLSYEVMGKIKSMDAWGTQHWAAQQDYLAAKQREVVEKQARDELRYNIKQHKREWRELAALVSQGINPASILKGIRG